MAADPIETGVPELPQSWNKYVYGTNNPLSFTDPRGTDPRSIYLAASIGGSSKGEGGKGGVTTDFGSQSRLASASCGPDNCAPPGSYVETITVYATPDDEGLVDVSDVMLDLAPPKLAAKVAAGGVFAMLGRLFRRGTIRHLAGEAVEEGVEAAAKRITFGHGARHLTGTGLTSAEVEGAIAEAIQAGASTAVGTYVVDTVAVRGIIIEYRAYTLATGAIHVGTYFPR